jgi:preprotein translocase subunit SecD
LIFSRIKEELSSGSSLKLAVSKGFDRAIITIMDSNLTTLIIGIVLFIIGSGAVKGFAVTLSIGIITSVFSAIFISRMLIEIILRYKIKNTKICI